MKLSRRRFLTISAAFALTPTVAQAHSWRGHAFGAEVSLEIKGPREMAEPALREARELLHRIERLFSLYDPTSDLLRLNAVGTLTPDVQFDALMQAADFAYQQTGGLFDPTVQPLWKALADGGDTDHATSLIGWDRVRFDADRITLGEGQALTFNGIAQGFATDVISDALRARGLKNTLVNIGEYRGDGGPWTLGLSDPIYGHMGTRTLTSGAIATSSPLGAGEGHILHPSARPQWSTVSVEAENATLADSLSTALTLAPRDQIEEVRKLENVRRITLIDLKGNLTTL